MDIRGYSTKDIGILGERVACEYLRRHGFSIGGTNVRARFGELDIVAEKDACLHIVEVKSRRCVEFPTDRSREVYDPANNLHQRKLQKVSRMGSWYVLTAGWEGDWQVDGILVWLRERDGMARVSYYPQVL